MASPLREYLHGTIILSLYIQIYFKFVLTTQVGQTRKKTEYNDISTRELKYVCACIYTHAVAEPGFHPRGDKIFYVNLIKIFFILFYIIQINLFKNYNQAYYN